MGLHILQFGIVRTLLVAVLVIGATDAVAAQAKGKVKPPPDLKIISIETAPRPYVPTISPLTLTITVELPKVIPEDALLDVTTLITSTSRSSFRLLTSRQPVPGNSPNGADLAPQAPRRLEVIQNWDGMDNNARIIAEGLYDYQVQAKLMVPNKAGAPLTRMTAWKKRGNIEVKAPPSARPD